MIQGGGPNQCPIAATDSVTRWIRSPLKPRPEPEPERSARPFRIQQPRLWISQTAHGAPAYHRHIGDWDDSLPVVDTHWQPMPGRHYEQSYAWRQIPLADARYSRQSGGNPLRLRLG